MKAHQNLFGLKKLLVPEPEYVVNYMELGLSHEEIKRRLKPEYSFGYMGQDVVFWSVKSKELRTDSK